MDYDLTGLMERIEAFEARLGVDFQGLFATINENGYVTVNGELYATDSSQLLRDVQLIVSIHDSAGRVIQTGNFYFSMEEFFGFQAFSIFLGPVLETVAKIRIYPK